MVAPAFRAMEDRGGFRHVAALMVPKVILGGFRDRSNTTKDGGKGPLSSVPFFAGPQWNFGVQQQGFGSHQAFGQQLQTHDGIEINNMGLVQTNCLGNRFRTLRGRVVLIKVME
jgi:hypothetical protein